MLHGLLEELSIFRLVDGLSIRSDETDAVRVEKAVLGKLHSKRESGLAAEPGEQAVRLFLFDDAPKRFYCQRLEVDFVRERAVGHDGRGIGVDEHDVYARFL